MRSASVRRPFSATASCALLAEAASCAPPTTRRVRVAYAGWTETDRCGLGWPHRLWFRTRIWRISQIPRMTASGGTAAPCKAQLPKEVLFLRGNGPAMQGSVAEQPAFFREQLHHPSLDCRATGRCCSPSKGKGRRRARRGEEDPRNLRDPPNPRSLKPESVGPARPRDGSPIHPGNGASRQPCREPSRRRQREARSSSSQLAGAENGAQRGKG